MEKCCGLNLHIAINTIIIIQCRLAKQKTLMLFILTKIIEKLKPRLAEKCIAMSYAGRAIIIFR